MLPSAPMRRQSVTVSFGLLAIACAGLFTGCEVKTDLGVPCLLVRKDPADTNPNDGYNYLPILESEVTEGKDFISFGSVECEDYVCVRDKDFPKGTNPNVAAQGYCSRRCAPTSPQPCPGAQANIAPGRTMSCRALILDEQTLGTICRDDPETCTRVFGDTRSPYLCAMNALDAGM